MPTVPVDLYRCGNGGGPKLANVRLGRDVMAVTDATGQVLVLPCTGGVSSFDRVTLMRGHWWKISKGELYDFRLVLRRGSGGHWTWEPQHKMTVEEYVLGLLATEARFTKS